ncbi:hypothetical protein PY310_17800 [Pseudarthrobacter sp. H3Y2-7]|uniref:hypothetical protein n=1 Tax=Pseudarthrobacter naphthalenicus TaxID=3031328 RepID=UPI0023B01DE7|nr:hypothetical protein [Pseudarthrobacter sp. H3Y2-7]MDE8670436.1 hypothetical protein [Pseudarthrobacter sp. H3Y2-7]
MGDSATIALNLTFFGTLGLAFLMFVGLFLLVILTLVLAGVGRLLVLAVQALFGRLPRNETLPLVHLTGATGHPSDAPRTTHDDAAAAPSAATRPPAGVPRAAAFVAGVRRMGLPNVWGRLKPSGQGARLQDGTTRHPLPGAPRREQQALAEDWAAAVAEADARAVARARAAAPEIKVTVRELPAPSLPAAKVEAVAPLVQSALHQDVPARKDLPGPGNTGPNRNVPAGTGTPDTEETAGTGDAVPAPGAARSFTKPQSPASPLDTGSLVSLTGHAKLLRTKLPANNNN